MAPCAREWRALFQEGGRRLVAWVLHHVEPECPEEAPPRLWLQGRASRRRRTPRATMATLVGPVVVWRRLYDPLGQGARAMPPPRDQEGSDTGLATPALAERIGGWAAGHAQRQVLALRMTMACRGRVPRCARSWAVCVRRWEPIARRHKSIRGSAGSPRPGHLQAGCNPPSRSGAMESMPRGATGHGKRGRRQPARSWTAVGSV